MKENARVYDPSATWYSPKRFALHDYFITRNSYALVDYVSGVQRCSIGVYEPAQLDREILVILATSLWELKPVRSTGTALWHPSPSFFF